MLQRGRKGRLQRETMSYALRPDRPAIHHLAPVPGDLEKPEAEIWRTVVSQRGFNVVGCSLLHSALRMRLHARTAQEIIARDGMTVPGRYGPKISPWVRIERNARALYFQILKKLNVQMEFDDDDFV